MKFTREIKTAILVIASILLGIWGYGFLRGKDLFTSYKTFYVEYDNVEGLIGAAPITINGLVVGKVNGIKIRQDGKLIVELQIKNTDLPISRTSEINIYEPGLIGGKQIQIIPNLKDQNIAPSGTTFKGGVKKGMTDLVAEKLVPLQKRVENVMQNVDALLINLNEVLDAKTKANLKGSIENLNETLAEFNGAAKGVNQLVQVNQQKIGNTLTSVDKVASNFSKFSDSLSKANVGKTVRKLENTLSNVDKLMVDIQSGKGSLGLLMKDEKLYTNVTKTSKELELLLQDLRLNPTRYINISLFGKKNKPYQSPTSDTLNSKNTR